MKATITNAAGETTFHKLDKFTFPKKGVQPEGYKLVDQEGNDLLARVTRSPWGAYTYVIYDGVSYSFPRHVELASGTRVEFIEGTVAKTKAVPAMDAKILPNMVEGIVQARKIQEASESVEEYYQTQMEPTPDPLEAASEWVRDQETKRGLSIAPTIAEYLPKVQPKTKPPRKALTK